MIRRTVLLAAMLGTSVAGASDAEDFARIKGSAASVGGLGAFLEKYIGDCSDPGGAGECRANAEKFRRESSGKKFFMIVNEDQAAMLSQGPVNESDGEFTINITPFFPSAGYALTLGKPKKTDGAGNPVMPFIYVRAPLPDGENASSVARMFRTRAFRMEVVFTPQGVWALPKKGGGKLEGVQAKIHAILVTNGRTGDEVLWTN